MTTGRSLGKKADAAKGLKVTRRELVCGLASAAMVRAFPPQDGWRGDFEWRPGRYQVHFIYTGRGESMFHIFPDGTSLLLDCGDSMRFHKTPKEAPLLPDLSRRAGEWVARYVERVNPKGRNVDCLATHSSTLAWKISWIGEPTGLPSMGSHRVGHD